LEWARGLGPAAPLFSVTRPSLRFGHQTRDAATGHFFGDDDSDLPSSPHSLEAFRPLNRALAAWVRRKYKRFKRRDRASMQWLARVAQRDPQLFVLWQLGVEPL